jgi:hypothetical protein
VFTLEEAKRFSKINHPVFAGYLLDGVVSELDLLATVFFLIKGNYLIPIFKDNNMTSNLISIRKGLKTPPSMFDKIFIKELFDDNNKISSNQVGAKIKSDSFQFTMNYCFEVFAGIEAKNRKYFANFNNRLVELKDSLDDDSERKKEKISNVLIVILLFLGIIRAVNDRELFPAILFYPAFIFVVYVYFRLYLFTKKQVLYDLSSDKKVMKMKNDYENMYDFLSKYPLNEHYITNEFLPFSIAFGIDQSWNKDFGLDKYMQVYYKA